MTQWQTCPRCGAVMTIYTGYTQCPVCGYRYPAQTTAVTTGTSTKDEYVRVVRCKDCKYYRDGDCWHERENDRWIYYQSVINEPTPDDYCSLGERAEE